MTDYTLSAWTSRDGNVHRVYVNGPDRSSLGYVERKEIVKARGETSYYDRHRTAKGDTQVVESDTVSDTLPEGARAALIEAVIAADPDRESDMRYDDIGMFLMLRGFAAGVGYMTDTAAKKRRRKQLAASFRFSWS